MLSTATNRTAVSALRASLTPHNYFWHPSSFVVLNMPRDVVLEASASARGGLEAVFLAGSTRLGLMRSCLGLDLTASVFWLGLEGSALPRLGSNQTT